MTSRIELTVDELVLDGFEEPAGAVELLGAELRRRLGGDAPERLGQRTEPVAAAIAKAAEGGVRR